LSTDETLLIAVVDAMPDIDRPEASRRRAAFRDSWERYAVLREQPENLWRSCLGKETLERVSTGLGLVNAEALEARIAHLWASGEVSRPREAVTLESYIDAIDVLQ